MRSKFLTAEWRKLAILNYAVDPAILLPYLPYRTELDFWNGKCYVSIVGFRFINTKLKGILIPFHTGFEEINLRFYVRFQDGASWKRGVSFIKEIVPKRALTLVANTIYKEKYVTLPTRSRWVATNDDLKVSYEWKHGGQWDLVSLTASTVSTEIPPGSEEEFITEHYWGYTRISNTRTSQYQVQHPRWQMYPVQNHLSSIRFGDLYGAEFACLQNVSPDSIMLAEGSEISVRGAEKIV